MATSIFKMYTRLLLLMSTITFPQLLKIKTTTQPSRIQKLFHPSPSIYIQCHPQTAFDAIVNQLHDRSLILAGQFCPTLFFCDLRFVNLSYKLSEIFFSIMLQDFFPQQGGCPQYIYNYRETFWNSPPSSAQRYKAFTLVALGYQNYVKPWRGGRSVLPLKMSCKW